MGIEKLRDRLASRKWQILFATLVLAFVVAVFASVRGMKTFRIHLIDEGEEHVILSKAASVAELLKAEGIEVGADTFVSEELDAKLSTDMKISVMHPKTYTIKLGNKELEVLSFSNDISEVLELAGLELDEDDYTNPPIYSTLQPGETLEVYQVGKFQETVEDEIPFASTERINKSMSKGKQKEIQAGVNGKKKSVYEVTFVNGQLSDRRLVSDEIVQKPVDRVVEKGGKAIVVASRSQDTDRRIKDVAGTGEVGKDGFLSDGTPYQKVIMMSSTAYDNSPAQNGGYTRTAMGTPLRRGVIAVDPSVIPLGTKVYVECLDGYPDYGYAVAEDIGSAIKGNRIDVCMGSGPTKYYGRRNVRVYILNK